MAVFLVLALAGVALLPNHPLLFVGYIVILFLAFLVLLACVEKPERRRFQRRRRRPEGIVVNDRRAPMEADSARK